MVIQDAEIRFQLTHLYEMWRRRRSCAGRCKSDFNSHISMRCDWGHRMSTRTPWRFQLTHLYEMWRGSLSLSSFPVIFQLTHLYEMWLCPQGEKVRQRDFNSHISMRCDHVRASRWIWLRHFNSHISMRCDNSSTHSMMCLAIFQLTHLYEMWLNDSRICRKISSISTHTSLWDVTLLA